MIALSKQFNKKCKRVTRKRIRTSRSKSTKIEKNRTLNQRTKHNFKQKKKLQG